MNINTSAVTGALSAQNIYSAIIKNQTSDKIHGLVEYRTLTGTDNQIIEFDINNNEEYKCEEKIHSTSTNKSDSSYSNIFPKIIYSLQIQKSDGTKLKLIAPFDNVPHENAHNWKFIVDNDQIHSVKC